MIQKPDPTQALANLNNTLEEALRDLEMSNNKATEQYRKTCEAAWNEYQRILREAP